MQHENNARLDAPSPSTVQQKVALDIDFSGSFRGYTEITIEPLDKRLRTVNLHLRQCQVHSITVASHTADYAYHDPLQNVNPSDASDPHRYAEVQRKLYSALSESDEGELSIALPPNVVVSEVDDPGLDLATGQTSTGPKYASIMVRIEYSLSNPVDGFQFVLPSDAYPHRAPHVYTTPSSPVAARCWVPCIDNLWQRHPWEFQFVVPRFLEDKDERDLFLGDDDENEDNGGQQTVVICSGDLKEQISHPYSSQKTIFIFSTGNSSASVQQIAFAAGPFHVHHIYTGLFSAKENSDKGRALAMHAFCLPGYESQLNSTVSFMRPAMQHFVNACRQYPYNSHKLVFVDEMPTQRFDAATMSLVSLDVLHGEDVIDQVFESRLSLTHALVSQWFGVDIIPKAWSDAWLVNGLALYLTGHFVQKLFGVNEYRFRMKKDMMRVVELDDGSMPPICQPNALDPPEGAYLAFIHLKAPLILHMLDRYLGKSSASLGLPRVLSKVFTSSASGELIHTGLGTGSFLRACRRTSGVDPRSFADQWIFGSGCPQFGFSASFNRKKMAVEITMRQESPAFRRHEHDPVALAVMKPVVLFEGSMTVRIHEADGTPYEHVLDIRSAFKRYEVPFNTKYKRVRRNTKRYAARQAAAIAAAEGDADAAEAMNMVDMAFGLEIWENERERENWKVADWTEEDEQMMSGATYEWIRMDADTDWIAGISFDQPDFMWISQLQRDRDVIAQLEAINAISRQPSAVVCSTLTKTVLVSNYFFRVRCEAALALVACATRKLEFLGLFHLFKMFLRYCYEPEDPAQDLFSHKYVPRPNDFTDMADYFVRKSLITAISRVRFEDGKTPTVIRQFLIDQLRYNDNTANSYSDALYICTLISALGGASVSTIAPERGELLPSEARAILNVEDINLLEQAIGEVNRYRNMDRLIPSPHNVVTIAALEWHLLLNLANLIPDDPRIFLTPTREGNYTQVRIAAFDGLFLSKWYTPKIMRYVFAVMANDSSRVIRRHVAHCVCESLALLVSIGEIKNVSKEDGILIVEEEAGSTDKMKEKKKGELEMMLKTLRKDKEVGRNEMLRDYLMPTLLAPDIDWEVRWSVLKLADLVLKPADEPPPAFKIHIPPTPVVETAPPIPVVRLQAAKLPNNSSRRPSLKPPATPVTPVNGSLKLKLASNLQTNSSQSSPITSVGSSVVSKPKKLPSTVLELPPPAPPKPKKPPPPPPPKKEKPQIKALAGGMSMNDLRAARTALRKLVPHKHSLWFRNPVDPVRDGAPQYFDIIKKPMDLSTMNTKLEGGLYSSRVDFVDDFKLIISNAKQYNGDNTPVYNQAAVLDSVFEKHWAAIERTLEQKAGPAEAASTTAPTVQRAPSPSPPPEPAPVQVPPAAASRTIVKLKLGGPGSASTAATSTSTPAKPPKSKKPPGPLSVPSPVLYDDGSADLLEEVIAIERERGERRPPPSKKHDKLDKTSAATKRKSPAEPLLGEPAAKKEKPSDPSTAPSSVKLKTDIPERQPSTPSSAARPRIVLKSKEKELANPTATPSAPPTATAPATAPARSLTPATHAPVPARSSTPVIAPPATPLPSKGKKAQPTSMPINEKKCKEILKVLKKVPESVIFWIPVDPVRDGCPTYYDEIKDPMDFQTMEQKLTAGKYATMEDFVADMDLIWRNCRQFNPPTTPPTVWVDVTERAFKKEWAKAMEKKLSYNEKRSLVAGMKKVIQDPVSFWFREPVDPVALGIPMYFDIIPRKDARDLRMILEKLEADKYDSADGVYADAELMASNAVRFNGDQSDVAKAAIEVRKRVKEVVDDVKGMSSRKRKEAPTPTSGSAAGSAKPGMTGQPLKKIKLA